MIGENVIVIVLVVPSGLRIFFLVVPSVKAVLIMSIAGTIEPTVVLSLEKKSVASLKIYGKHDKSNKNVI